MSTTTLNATDFKAKCLDVLDQLSDRRLERVVITKRGKPVAVLTPPVATADAVASLHGFMRGSVVIPPGTDLTAPVLDEPFDAELGVLHR
jgi:prevent-host-death family protein